MTHDQAKETLRMYRPWTADAKDPAFAAALALAHQETALADWFEQHCTVQSVIRDRLRQNRAPQGLQARILAGHATQRRVVWLHRPVVWAAAALVILTGALAVFWVNRSLSSDSVSLTGFSNRMLKSAVRMYSMDLETSDATKIRNYLAARKAVADYQLPGPLEQTPSTGCGVLIWQGHKVSMVCFRTGKPLPPGSKSDLFLFVIERGAIPNAPTGGKPVLKQTGTLATASWSSGGKVYLLAADGDEQLLRKFL